MAVISEISELSGKRLVTSPGPSSGTGASSFSSEILLEQADIILKNTGQYHRWSSLRQKNGDKAQLLAQLVIDRHEMVTTWQSRGQLDVSRFDRITAQLFHHGIKLYDSRQLQDHVTINREVAKAHQAALGSHLKHSSGTSSPTTTATQEQADRLLQNTNQHDRWRTIRQNNDKMAEQLAAALLERHSLLQAAKSNQPVNQAAFDQLTGQLAQAGIHLYTFKQLNLQQNPHSATGLHPYLPAASAATAPPPLPLRAPDPLASQDNSIARSANSTREAGPDITPQPVSGPAHGLLTEENLLILNLQSKQLQLNQTVFAYGDENTVMLPLGRMVKALDFDIQADPDRGIADGWYINEQRVFSLDLDRKQAVVDGMTLPLQTGTVIAGDDDIYIDAKTFSSWFPVDLDLSRSEMTLSLTPREKLPYQLKLEREQKEAGLSGLDDIPLKYPVKDLEYDLFSLPVLDVTLHGGQGSEELQRSELQGQYSILARGDLAYMNSYAYASGIEDSPLNTARIRLERVDPQENLLGSLHANRVAVGDILPATFPILPNSTPERGLYVSNTDLNRSVNYDSTRFEGNLTPGWEVELYHNGAFIQRQAIGANGRYLFDNVPVYYGTNDFEVLAYGPQGQKQILEKQQFTVGSGMLPRGDGIYEFSASQYEHTLLGIDEKDSPVDNDQPRLTGRYQYGLTDNLSAGAGISSLEFSGERHNYLQAGISGNFWSSYGEIDFLQDTSGGTGLSLSGQTALGPVNINATQEFFSDFVMENRPEATLESKTALQVNGTIPRSAISPPLSYTVSSQYLKYSEDETANLSARISGRFSNIYLSNSTTWNYRRLADDTTDIDGLFQASGDIGPVRTTGDLKYRLGDTNEITRFTLSGQWQVDRSLRAGFDVIHEPDLDDRTTAGIKLDWDAGPAFITPSLSYDSEGNFGAFLTLSFSLGRDPDAGRWNMSSDHSAEKGNVSTFVYHDANNNKQFDADDTPLPNVKVHTVQSWGETVTDADGYGLISGLQSYKPTDVELDTETLEDPFWMPSTEGSAIQPRPGHFDRIEFPIVTTGEIDGTVYIVGGDDSNDGNAGMKLELLDLQNEVVREIHTEYDGFYLFEKVLPGEYTVRVSPGEVENGFSSQEHQITIGNDGTIVSGKDIILRNTTPVQEKSIPPSQAVESPLQRPIHIAAESVNKVKRPLPEPTIQAAQSAPDSDEQDIIVVAPPPKLEAIANTSETLPTAALHETRGIAASEQKSPTVTLEVEDPKSPAESTIPHFLTDPAFPVVEYSAGETNMNGEQNRRKRGSTGSSRREIGFTVIPPPISPFTPIDTTSLQETRTIEAYPAPTVSPVFTNSQDGKSQSDPRAGSSNSEFLKKNFHVVG